MSDLNNLTNYLPDASSDLINLFIDFATIVEKYNNKINLVSRSSIMEIGSKHIYDSYMGCLRIPIYAVPGDTVFDFGSGNGFPGIIGALMYPGFNFILVERDQRKVQFLKTAIKDLGLTNVDVFPGNVSDLKPQSCKLVISRAMSPLDRFLVEVRRVTTQNAQLLLFKGAQWSTELGSCQPVIFDHWSVTMDSQYTLPDKNKSERFILLCKKIG
jgi:16S rRNA (guanine527-N7)-methyltransferase